jgi:hypothetical protein
MVDSGFVRALIIAVPFAAGLWMCARYTAFRHHPQSPVSPASVVEKAPVRITQFYASPGVLTEGETSSLCFGVENARSVRIVPEIDRLKPALTRCLQIAPVGTTSYKLIATGFDDQEVSESLTVQVKENPLLAPRILSFSAKPAEAPAGTAVTLCYAVENASSVKMEPNALPETSAPRGCFWVVVQQTTTYRLIALGPKNQSARREVTIRVR